VTKRWVIIVGDRGLPAFAADEPNHPQQDRDVCPFCPGKEPGTPPEILAYRDGDQWLVRVVANKFPALIIEGILDRAGDGLYDKMSGIGAHEVIIEHPSHSASFATYSVREVERIVWSYRERSRDLRKDPRFKYLLVFKNSGRPAGASLSHPHSQLIATPVIPKRVIEELNGAENYFHFRERCVYCDMLRQETASKRRLVFENERFVVFTPFASRFPFELVILPKMHSSDFAETSDSDLRLFAIALREAMGRLIRALGDPPYNYILHTSPVNGSPHEAYHWHVEIITRMTRVAGFEWGSGFYVNPVSPEEACRRLSECTLYEDADGHLVERPDSLLPAKESR